MNEDANIDISKYSKSDVLKALYDRAKPQGVGFLHYHLKPMDKQEASVLLAQGTYFDYIHGRVLKVDLSKDTFDPYLYDRDNGDGAAQSAIDTICESG